MFKFKTFFPWTSGVGSSSIGGASEGSNAASGELASTGSIDHVAIEPTAGVAGSLPERYRVVVDSMLCEESDSPTRDDIVHESLKGLDVSFGMVASALEKDAREAARAEAERGLPRHDLEIQEPLEVEKQLRQRALQIYWQWHREVRRRINGALARELRRIRTALTAANVSLGSYEAVREELDALTPLGLTNQPQRDRLPADDRPVDCETTQFNEDTVLEERTLGRWFWPLVVALLGVEFVANAPVFAELLPQDRAFNRQMAEWAASGGAISWASGLLHSLGRMLTSPDASVMAFGIMTFVLVLGHVFGAGVANRMALSRSHPNVPGGLAAQMRQRSGFLLALSMLGIVIVLIVLFVARRSVLPMAQGRLAQSQQELDKANSDLKTALADDDEVHIQSTREKVHEFQQMKQDTQSRFEYAQSITAMSLPILGLNGVLVIVAAIAGLKRQTIVVTAARKQAYLQRTAAGTPASGISEPGPAVARSGQLRDLSQRSKTELGAHLIAAETAYSRAQQLIGAAPMQDPGAVTSRLLGVISIFRAENARQRHLDSRDIKAFRGTQWIEFPPLSFEVSPELSVEMEELRKQLARLQAEHEQLARPVRVREPEAPIDVATTSPTGVVS